MIGNRNMKRDARKHVFTATFEPLQVGFQAQALLDMECDIRILRIDSVFAVASGASEDETITVGIPGTLTKYLSYAVADSQSAGTKVAHTIASADILAAGTALIVKKATAAADAASTAVLAVNITYERIDRTATN